MEGRIALLTGFSVESYVCTCAHTHVADREWAVTATPTHN